MSIYRFCSLVLLVVSLWRCSPALADAEDTTDAEVVRLIIDGRLAFSRGEFPKARRLLDKAFARFPAPTVGLWSARAFVRDGWPAQAVDRYRQALVASTRLGDEATQSHAQHEARRELETLLPTVPSLSLQVQAPVLAEVRIHLDGQRLASPASESPRLLNPGTHRLMATRPGMMRRYSLTLAEAEHRTLEIDLTAPTSAWAHVGLAALIVGGASLVGAAVTAILAANTCPTGECTAGGNLAVYERYRVVSGVSFYAGMAGVVGGLLALLWGEQGGADATQEGVGDGPSSRLELR